MMEEGREERKKKKDKENRKEGKKMVTADSCGCRGTASFAKGNNAVLFSADVQRRFLSFLTSAAGYFFGSRGATSSNEGARMDGRQERPQQRDQVQQGRRTDRWWDRCTRCISTRS